MYECSQCGAQLRFDIQTQLLHCDHCGADFNPETFQPKDAAEESKDAYGVTVFRCRQCGAELVSTTNSAVGFCIYCGAQNMLESRLETRNRPARIIPFHLTKDDCREVYRKKIRNALYAPRELRDTKELEKFRGIYVPYWVYDADFNQSVQIPASEQVQNGDYIVDSDYQVTVTIHGGCHGIACDASSSFDDHVAEMIAPYSAKKMVPFNPAYLAGFYADTADVPAETYAEWAADFATEQAMDAVRKRVNTGSKAGGGAFPGLVPHLAEKGPRRLCDRQRRHRQGFHGYARRPEAVLYGMCGVGCGFLRYFRVSFFHDGTGCTVLVLRDRDGVRNPLFPGDAADRGARVA